MSIVSQKYKTLIFCIKICGTILTIVCFLIVGLATHTKEEVDKVLYMGITPTPGTGEKDEQTRNVKGRESVSTTPNTLEKDDLAVESCEKNGETMDISNEK